MPLTWSLENVQDSDELCWVEATQDDPNHGVVAGKKYMSPVTNSLIWSTIAVDLPGPTAANVGEFFARLRLTEMMHGPFLIRAVDPETGKRPEGEAAFITIDEVIAHIGLRCNVGTETRAKWLKRIGRDMDGMVHRAERRLEELTSEAGVVAPR
jgi:hypothetical protein